MSRTLIENKLVTLRPGDYLRAGGDGSALLTLKKETQGIVVRSVSDGHRENSMLAVVLVNGQLVNVWSESGETGPCAS